MGSSAGSSKRRKVLNLSEKIKLIQSYDNSNGKKTVRELAAEFGIGKTAAAECLKRRKEIADMLEENVDDKRCRKKVKSVFDELDEVTWKWFSAAREKDMRISGPLIQEKALEFSEKLGIQNFKASNGWLERFKQQHYIKQFQVSGESADVDPDTVAQWKARLPLLIEGYSLDDVFNTDETGLYYRAMPDKTLAAKGDA